MRGQPLQTFFLKELRELYRREKRWLIILPEVKRNLPPLDVEQAVEQHLEQTVAQVLRLEEMFALMAVVDRNCLQTVTPLLKEADEVLAAVTLSSLSGRGRRSCGSGLRFFAVGCQN